MKRNYAYVDPQSMLNLANYDHHLLTNIEADDIHYVCSKFYDYRPLPPNVHQHRLFRYNHLGSKTAKAVSYMFSYLTLLFCLLRWQPQVVHIQWLRIPAFDLFFYKLIKRLLHTRIVFTAHNILPHDSGDRYKWTMEKFYRLTDKVIVHTNTTRNDLLAMFHLPADKVTVIPHGILDLNCDEQKLHEAEEQLDRHYQLEGKMVFASLGHQYYYKGVDVIAKVWAETPELRDNPHCRLLFVGRNRGVDLSVAEGIANVTIEDRLLSDEEFYYLLRHTDVHLLTYRNISQSGLLLTAISTQTPILVTDIGGLTEPLSIAPIGWVLPQLDEEHVRQQLLWFLHHPEEIEKVKNDKASWQRVHQNYDWKNIGRETQDVYEAVV